MARKKAEEVEEEVERKPGEFDERDHARAKYLRDYKAFYCDLIARDKIEPGINKKHRDCWGRIHSLAVDFATFGLPAITHDPKTPTIAGPDVVTYSMLPSYIPALDEDGNFKERWLYWPRIDNGDPPQIQEGPTGCISKMFYRKAWHGVCVRFKGNGSKRCTLMHRGGLKSTILTRGLTNWKMVRNPDQRNLLRAISEGLAFSFSGEIKHNFENNTDFTKYFGFLKPTRGQGVPWSIDALQLLCEKRAGPDPTLLASGMETDLTGKHPDYIPLDDVVTETNTANATQVAKATDKTRKMFALMNAGSIMHDYGTMYAEGDPHSLFLGADTDACFFVSTLLDANPEGDSLGLPGEDGKPMRGNAIWSEGYDRRRVLQKRKECDGDVRMWHSQFFNQLHGTAARLFSEEWVAENYRYLDVPRVLAVNEKLNIHVGIRVDAGRFGDNGANACVVVGQTRDMSRTYILDGFKEKTDPDSFAKGVVEMCVKWNEISDIYGGSFRAGMEKTAYEDFAKPLIEKELRKRHMSQAFAIEPIDHDKKSKVDAVAVLQQDYKELACRWPLSIFRVPLTPLDQNYDCIQLLGEEFKKFPGIVHFELMEAHAIARQLMQLPTFKESDREEKERIQSEDYFKAMKKRDEAFLQGRENEFEPSLGSFGAAEEAWGPAI